MKRPVKAAPRPSSTSNAVKVSMYLPAEVLDEVRAVAKKHERTLSWVVARAVKQLLDRAREGVAS